jgi:NAD(P)-dependent dehydrogenase (short-subunit alcohol dehydrogenase family)
MVPPLNILITGGAGFIGSNFIRHLLISDSQARIVNLDLLTYAGSLRNLADLSDATRHTFVQGDIADGPLVTRLMHEHDIGAVIHFAAESHVDRSIFGPAAFIQTNIIGTFTLLEAARDVWRGKYDRCRFIRDHALRTQFTLFGVESVFRPFGARVLRDIRIALDHHELFEQLRTVSVSGEADSADDHQCPDRQGAPGIR